MMGKRSFALILVLVLLSGFVAGCTNNLEDVVGMVGETPIYRWEYNAYMTSQLALYEKYQGVDLTRQENREDYLKYRDYRIEELVGIAAMKDEAAKLGLFDLTPEEEAQVDENYESYHESQMAVFIEQYGSDEAGMKKAEDAYLKLLSGSSYTPERFRTALRNQLVLNKYIDVITGQKEITEEEVKEYYDSQLAAYQEEIEKDPLWFGSNVTDPVLCVPEGYRETIRIALHFTEKQQSDITYAANQANTASSNYTDAVKLYGDGSSQAQKLITQMNKTAQDFDDTLERCYRELETRIEEIRNEVMGGADFIKTMEKVSDDSHKISYYVTQGSEHVESAFLKAALALEKEGDISDAVRINNGACIIKLVDIMEPGIMSFEDAKDELKKKMYNNERLNVSFGMQTEYAENAREAGIVEIYTNKLD